MYEYKSTYINLGTVTQAAESIVSRGEKVNIANMRKELGGGSYRDISPMYAQWRKNQRAEAEVENSAMDTVPERVRAAHERMTVEVWSAALEAANSRMAEEREAIKKKNHELEQDRDEAFDFADQLAAENDALKEALAIEQALVKELRLKHMDLG